MVGLLLPIALAILLGLALALLQKCSLVKQNQPTNLPPGNMGWPFCGETLGFLKPHNSNSIGNFLQDHCSRYGRIFKSHLFGSPTIVSCDLELNMYILQNEEKLFQCSYPRPIHGILGNLSLLTVSGSLHKKLRSVAIGFIGVSKSKPDFLHYIEKLSISMMKSWKECEEVVFFKEAKMFTFTLTVKHILSIEADDPLGSKILEDFLTFMKGFISLPLCIPGMPFAKAVKARARISTTIREIIREREQEQNQRPDEGDFLDVIMSKGLSDDEKVSLVLDLLLGGYETTATLMALVVYFLGNARLALEQLKEEHWAIRESKEEGEPLNWEDYKKMKFTQSVICEALRCGNVVKFVHRKAIQDVNFKGYYIPSGWKVLPIFTAVHLDPSLHEHPTEFNPWRWEDQAMSKKVIPFSGGLRLCPGAELARVEIAFFLHHLVLNFSWKPKGDDYPLAYPYVEFPRGLALEIEHARGWSE